jgi:hypothetical protein
VLSYISLFATEREFGEERLTHGERILFLCCSGQENRGLLRKFSATVKGRRRWVLRAAGPTIY